MKVKFGDKELTLNGLAPKHGDKVEAKGALAGSFDQVKFDNKGKMTVLSTFPSIDTKVCDLQVGKLAHLSEKYTDFNFVSFSLDLPPALADYKANHPTGRVEMYSDYFDKKTVSSLGMLINELQLATRAVFVLDKENKLVYSEVKDQVKDQVDFDALEEVLKKY
ncbi:redoxin family protein [Mycoplasmopsis synoviae]|uniref:Thiol peroxidase n=2 Tax=Mycoplasmopsis synoviae TaxID=2109 RepID=Q4A641_MYCS5|nr:redoxin family protein [Mycoplasmopsis synoviae]AAZ43780.1 thiol peroxidase [Mycoplasmopsis synoviae 53]AKB11106.1 thiol peroxidase [Mycoplasmopsis synoviae ATCC 25204]AKJ20590.1 Thiol peroxidase, Tpx-type [Mycoplasmopsis synoviae]AQU47910.1 Thiol peroxidase, Tpx-type [Mycoplasmopsis synoviae]AWL84157.1 thiol peroxidase [Mycoplasmopsis synoviae]